MLDHKDNTMKALVLIAAAMMIAGCASVPMAGGDQDARAKSFAVAPGKANVYVYRNEILGAALKLQVTFDGQVVGDTAAKSYFALEVAPGRHTLASQSDGNGILELNTVAGKNYFVWQEVKMGILSGGSKLQVVDDTTGRAGVNECSLIVAANGLSAAPAAVSAPAASPAEASAPAPVAAPSAAPAAAPATAAVAPAPSAPAAAVPGLPGVQMPVYKQSPSAAGKPVARGKFEFEAESAAMASGCKTADGARPLATLIDTGGGFEVFDVKCVNKSVKVRCESFGCAVN